MPMLHGDAANDLAQRGQLTTTVIILLPFNTRDRAVEDNFDLLRSRAMASGVPSAIAAASNGTQAVRVALLTVATTIFEEFDRARIWWPNSSADITAPAFSRRRREVHEIKAPGRAAGQAEAANMKLPM
jgi:hypothetical protein